MRIPYPRSAAGIGSISMSGKRGARVPRIPQEQDTESGRFLLPPLQQISVGVGRGGKALSSLQASVHGNPPDGVSREYPSPFLEAHFCVRRNERPPRRRKRISQSNSRKAGSPVDPAFSLGLDSTYSF